MEAISTIYNNFVALFRKQKEMFPYEVLVEYRKCLAWPSRINKINFEAACTRYMNLWLDINGQGSHFEAIMSAQRPNITVRWPRSSPSGKVHLHIIQLSENLLLYTN